MKFIKLFASQGLTHPYSVCINGESEVVVCGCARILVYEENLIRLKLKKGSISIIGNSLSMRAYNLEEMHISGVICAVELESGRKTEGAKK